jgi:hypothetical protein
MSPSSRGLGHCPFTAATGVRIPLGTPYLWRLLIFSIPVTRSFYLKSSFPHTKRQPQSPKNQYIDLECVYSLKFSDLSMFLLPKFGWICIWGGKASWPYWFSWSGECASVYPAILKAILRDGYFLDFFFRERQEEVTDLQ